MGRAFIPVSFESYDDIPNLAGEISTLMFDARDVLEATAHTTGTNGIVPLIYATAGSRVTTATSGTFAVADLYSLQNALPARHSARASFGASLTVINAARQFATANNYHAFLTDLAGDAPARLLGRNLYEFSPMSSTISAGEKIAIYGDVSKYHIADHVLGTRLEFIPNLFGANGRPTGQRGYLLTWRTGQTLVDTDALRVLVVKA